MKQTTIIFAIILMIMTACSTEEIIVIEDTDNDTQVIENTNDNEDTSAQNIEPTEEPTDVPTQVPTIESPTDVPTVAPTVVPTEVSTEEPVIEDTTVAYNGPAWVNLELVNANTNETFTLADFAGKTVFIEPMATWCTNCRGQQRRISEVINQLDPNEFVVMSLSVETHLTPGELASYSVNNGFDWTFAVASDELLTALVTEFGRSVSSPPSVPHFTISADGTVGNFTTGSKSGEEFLSLVRSVAAES